MDLAASRLGEIYQDVTTEPAQLPLNREHLRYRTVNTSHETRLGVSAADSGCAGSGYSWTPAHSTRWLLVTVSCPWTPPSTGTNSRQGHVNQDNFTTLVFTPSGEMGLRDRSFNARLAELISEKKYYPMSRSVAYMKFRLLFSLLRSAILSQGHRTLAHKRPNITKMN